MKQLIESLGIFLYYGDQQYPTHCNNETMYVVGTCYHKEKMAPDHLQRLESLGWFWDDNEECWASYRYGSV